MKEFFSNPKFKNPIFWTSLIAILFASAGVDFNTLTSWKLLLDALLNIFINPVATTSVVIALVGVFNDNSTNGMDSLKYKK